MPKITNTLNNPRAATLLSPTTVSLPAAREGTGLQELGRSIENIGEDLIRKKNKAETTAYVAHASIAATEKSVAIEEELKETLNQNPSEYSDQYISRISEEYSKLIQNAPTAEASNQLTQQLGARANNLRLNTLKTQQSAIANNLFKQSKSNMTVLENRAFDRPDEFETIMEQRNQTVVASQSYLSPENVARFDKESRKAIVEAYLKGLVGREPARAKNALESDAFDEVLSSDDQLRFQRAIEAEEAKREREAIKEKATRVEAVTLEREIGIFKNQVEQVDLDTDLQKGRYGKEEWLALSKKLETRLAKENATVLSIQSIDAKVSQGTPIDTTSKQNRKALDNHFNATIVPTMDEENAQETLAAYIDKYNYIPTEVKGNLIAGLHNGSPKLVEQSALMIDSITKENPELIHQFQKTRDLARARHIASSRLAGMPLEDAIKSANNLLVEKNTTEWKEREKDFKASARELDQGEFTSLFVNDPNEVPEAMKADWKNLYKNYAVNLRMADDDAKNLAYDITKAQWGISRATGDPRYMKHAPEKYYNKSGFDPIWIEDQLKSDIASIDPAIEDFDIAVDPTTLDGPNPGYLIQYRNDFGLLLPLRDEDGDIVVWRPNIEESEEAGRQLNESVEKARAKRRKAIKEKTIDIDGGIF